MHLSAVMHTWSSLHPCMRCHVATRVCVVVTYKLTFACSKVWDETTKRKIRVIDHESKDGLTVLLANNLDAEMWPMLICIAGKTPQSNKKLVALNLGDCTWSAPGALSLLGEAHEEEWMRKQHWCAHVSVGLLLHFSLVCVHSSHCPAEPEVCMLAKSHIHERVFGGTLCLQYHDGLPPYYERKDGHIICCSGGNPWTKLQQMMLWREKIVEPRIKAAAVAEGLTEQQMQEVVDMINIDAYSVHRSEEHMAGFTLLSKPDQVQTFG